jgi:hypothetical protein
MHTSGGRPIASRYDSEVEREIAYKYEADGFEIELDAAVDAAVKKEAHGRKVEAQCVRTARSVRRVTMTESEASAQHSSAGGVGAL